MKSQEKNQEFPIRKAVKRNFIGYCALYDRHCGPFAPPTQLGCLIAERLNGYATEHEGIFCFLLILHFSA